MSNISEIMNKLPDKFMPDAATGFEACFQILIEDDAPYLIKISGGSCEVTQAEDDDADVTLIMDSNTFAEVMSGESSGTAAFMSGKIRAEGDVMLATNLSKLFKK